MKLEDPEDDYFAPLEEAAFEAEHGCDPNGLNHLDRAQAISGAVIAEAQRNPIVWKWLEWLLDKEVRDDRARELLELRPLTTDEKAADYWQHCMTLAESSRFIAEFKREIAEMEAEGDNGPELDEYRRELAEMERRNAYIREWRGKLPLA